MKRSLNNEINHRDNYIEINKVRNKAVLQDHKIVSFQLKLALSGFLEIVHKTRKKQK